MTMRPDNIASNELAYDSKIVQLVLFSRDATALKEKLKEESLLKNEGVKPGDIDKATKVVASSNLGEGVVCAIDERTGDLKVSREYFASVVKAKFGNVEDEINTIDLPLDGNPSVNPTGLYDGLTLPEQEAHNILINTSNILKRVFNRRNGLLSWIFLGVLKAQGIMTGEDKPQTFVDEVETAIVGDKEFIKNYAKCYSNEMRVDDIDKAFGKNYEHKKLAKLVGLVSKVAKNVPTQFVDWFPRAFAVQNILLPFILKPIKNTGIGKLLSWVRVLNPFVDEFINTYLALCGDELKHIKDAIGGHGDKNPIVIYADGKMSDKKDVKFAVGEIIFAEGNAPLPVKEKEPELQADVESGIGHTVESVLAGSAEAQLTESELSAKESEKQEMKDREALDLQNIIFTTSSAVKRLTRPRNLSGIIFEFFLDKVAHFKNYDIFENQVIKTPGFIKGMYKHLNSLDKNSTLAEVANVQDSFDTPHEQATAKVALGIMSLTRSLPDWVVKTLPKMFGLPYSIFYLGVPILNKIVGEDSLMGKLIDYAQMIVPTINDLVIDPIASAFEEANVVRDLVTKKANENLFSGMPQVSFATSWSWLLKSVRNLGQSIKMKPGAATPAAE